MSDLHAVFAATADGNRYRITSSSTNNDALETWQRMDERHRNHKASGLPCRISGSQVDYFNVRRMDDENWNAAPLHTEHGCVQWGWQAEDFGPGGDQWHVTKKVRLSDTQSDAMAAAAEYGQIPDSTHHKTYHKLFQMGLIRHAEPYSDLTPLGQAVANRAYVAEHGATITEVKAIKAAKAEQARIEREAKAADIKDRCEALCMYLTSDLHINGKPAPEALLTNDYNTPMYLAGSDAEGFFKITLSELEAIVTKLVEEY